MYTLYDIILISLFSLQVLYISIFFSYMLEHRYSPRTAILIGWFILTAGVVLTYKNYSNVLLRQFTFLMNAFIVCQTMYKSSWKEDMFSIAIVWIISCVCDSVVACFVFAGFPEASNYFSGFDLVLANIFYDIIYIPVMHMVLFFWKKHCGQILNKSIYATFLFPVSQCVMMEFLVLYISLQVAMTHCCYPWAIAVAVAGMILYIMADIFLFQVILADSQRERLAAQLEVMNLQAGRELEYYHFINEKIQENRMLRHDFGNQLQMIYDLIQNDRMSEAETPTELSKVMEVSGAGWGASFPANFCENRIVNVILEEKTRIAVRHGVALYASVELPEKFFVKEVDLCSIFTNLLDNAIRAAARVSENRRVHVTASVSGGCCRITTVNPCCRDSERFSVPTFSVRKTDVHGGYGLWILRSIGETYGGELITQEKNGQFTASLTLNETAGGRFAK